MGNRVRCYLLEDTGENRAYEDDPDSSWRVFRNPATGEETSLKNAEPGAMFRSELYTSGEHSHSPDGGFPLWVKLPDGVLWNVDGIASNCGHTWSDWPEGHHCWNREGEPPNVTASPSIQTGTYHGWLREGWLEEV